jgi:hypothetical protein
LLLVEQVAVKNTVAAAALVVFFTHQLYHFH